MCNTSISEQQLDLLPETDVHKRMTQKEWAEAHGVSYDPARMWHHRARQSIREYEKKRRHGANGDRS